MKVLMTMEQIDGRCLKDQFDRTGEIDCSVWGSCPGWHPISCYLWGREHWGRTSLGVGRAGHAGWGAFGTRQVQTSGRELDDRVWHSEEAQAVGKGTEDTRQRRRNIYWWPQRGRAGEETENDNQRSGKAVRARRQGSPGGERFKKKVVASSQMLLNGHLRWGYLSPRCWGGEEGGKEAAWKRLKNEWERRKWK